MVSTSLSSLCRFGLLLVLVAPACAGYPDRKSGGDAYRNEAQPMVMGKWLDDTLDRSKGDRTDWKSVRVDQPGRLVVSLSSDKDNEVGLSLYDKYGYPLGTDLKKEGSASKAKVVIKAKMTGLYFVRIRAKSGGPATYSIKASMGDDADATDSGGGDDDLPDF